MGAQSERKYRNCAFYGARINEPINIRSSKYQHKSIYNIENWHICMWDHGILATDRKSPAVQKRGLSINFQRQGHETGLIFLDFSRVRLLVSSESLTPLLDTQLTSSRIYAKQVRVNDMTHCRRWDILSSLVTSLQTFLEIRTSFCCINIKSKSWDGAFTCLPFFPVSKIT